VNSPLPPAFEVLYTPAAWLTATFKVAPTRRVEVPPVRVPVPLGLLTQVSIVIVWTPFETVVAPAGRVMTYVAAATPVTVKLAARGVPPAIIVTPPVVVRELSVARTQVPDVALDARFPKSISTVFDIAIGVRIVAAAEDVADDCANVAAVIANNKIPNAISFFIFSILI